MEVVTKLQQKKLNTVLQYREYDDNLLRVANNMGEEIGENLCDYF